MPPPNTDELPRHGRERVPSGSTDGGGGVREVAVGEAGGGQGGQFTWELEVAVTSGLFLNLLFTTDRALP